MTCRIARWLHRTPRAQDPRSVQAVLDSHESVRRNQERALEVAEQTAALTHQIERNHLAERMTLAMRKAHQA